MRSSTCHKTQVFRANTFTLHHYHQDKPAALSPLLIVFSMINTPAILDIHPDRSFIKALLDQGLSVYLLEWCPNLDKHKDRPMAEYIIGDIDEAMDYICMQDSIDKLHVMGICQGGYFSVCLNAIKPERFESIIPVVTPIDFHAAGCKLNFTAYKELTIGKWMELSGVVPPFVSQSQDFLSGDSLRHLPFISGKYVSMMLQSLDPLYIFQNKCDAWQGCNGSVDKQALFFAIEAWSQDYPDQPTQVMIDFFHDAIENNALIHKKLILHDHCVDLENINNPILNIYAKKDYFWSEATPNALSHYHSSRQYETFGYEGGHIGVFIGESALKIIPKRIAEFMRKISE